MLLTLRNQLSDPVLRLTFTRRIGASAVLLSQVALTLLAVCKRRGRWAYRPSGQLITGAVEKL